MASKALISMTLALALAACAGATGADNEMSVSQELAPMEMPNLTSHSWEGIKNGTPYSERAVGMNGELVVLEDDAGCRWIVSDLLAPTRSWENCAPFTDGSQEVSDTDSLWPLEVGKVAVFETTGENSDGITWQMTRTCKVESTARVAVPAGEFDTYKVRCRDRFTERVYYFAPDVGKLVRHDYTHHRRGLRNTYLLAAL